MNMSEEVKINKKRAISNISSLEPDRKNHTPKNSLNRCKNHMSE